MCTVVHMYGACPYYYIHNKKSAASEQHLELHSLWTLEIITVFSQNQPCYMLHYLKIFPEKFSRFEHIHQLVYMLKYSDEEQTIHKTKTIW